MNRSLSFNYILFLILVIGLTIYSCTREYDGHEISPINSDIVISKSSYGEPHIIAETAKDYACLMPIIYELDTGVNGEMEITFVGINKSVLCPAAVGPASAAIPIDTTTSFNFKMKHKRKWYTGSYANGELTLDNSGRVKLKE